MATQYRITGRLRAVDKRHVVDYGFKTKTEAERRLREIQRQAEWEHEHKQRKAVTCGMISVGTPYESDYDLLELRIESREVTPWQTI